MALRDHTHHWLVLKIFPRGTCCKGHKVNFFSNVGHSKRGWQHKKNRRCRWWWLSEVQIQSHTIIVTIGIIHQIFFLSLSLHMCHYICNNVVGFIAMGGGVIVLHMGMTILFLTTLAIDPGVIINNVHYYGTIASSCNWILNMLGWAYACITSLNALGKRILLQQSHKF